MTAMKVLIIGGAGYIGGVTAQQFDKSGHEVVVLDNLSTGHKHNIENLKLVEAEAGDTQALKNLFSEHQFDCVLDFAAKIQVGESVEKPKEYFINNSFDALTVIDEAVKAGVKNIILSSTGSLYGNPEKQPISEETPVDPLNPYAMSKYLTENILRSYGLTHNLNWLAFRYFNAAGAVGRIGPDYPFRTHLLPSVIHAQQKNEPVKIFGTDYDTADGTAVRDYIHVEDIARAHVVGAEKMAQGLELRREINLGTSHGFSVKEVIAMVEKVSGRPVQQQEEGRRDGDSPKTVASNELAKELLGWTPDHDLEKIVADALEWQHKYQPV